MSLDITTGATTFEQLLHVGTTGTADRLLLLSGEIAIRVSTTLREIRDFTAQLKRLPLIYTPPPPCPRVLGPAMSSARYRARTRRARDALPASFGFYQGEH